MFSKTPIISVSLYLLFSGCTGLKEDAPPQWILSPQNSYPTEQFLTGQGEGSTREKAEKKAYVAIARIFLAEVKSEAEDQESYSMQQTGHTHRTQRTLKITQYNQVNTRKVLENVQILKVWAKPSTQHFFVLAGLDRHKADKIITDRLHEIDQSIHQSVTQGRTNTQKIERIRGYKHALSLLSARKSLHSDLRIIRQNGNSQPSLYMLDRLLQEFQNFVAHELTIAVKINGENHKALERAILQGLQKEGLLGQHASTSMREGSEREKADIVIHGTERLWAVNLPDPVFTYVRWCANITIYDQPSNQLVGVISRTGMEGHITESEANVRARKFMLYTLTQEIARIFTSSYVKEEHSTSPHQTPSSPCHQ